MTETSLPIPPDALVLAVSFDVCQIGDQLLWTVFDGRANLMQTCGQHAGSVYFDTDGTKPVLEMWLALKGYGPPDLREYAGFDVVDTTLVSRPRSYKPETSTPSPFEGRSACVPVREFRYGKPEHDKMFDRYYWTANSDRPLRVPNTQGRWSLSMMLTVCIKPSGTIKVLTFDPEVQVGNGSGPTGL